MTRQQAFTAASLTFSLAVVGFVLCLAQTGARRSAAAVPPMLSYTLTGSGTWTPPAELFVGNGAGRVCPPDCLAYTGHRDPVLLP